jgi:translation elongation factor EF-4
MRFSNGVPAKPVSWGFSGMKRFGKVDIPAEAFTVMLKRD